MANPPKESELGGVSGATGHALVIVHGITVVRFGVKPLGRLKIPWRSLLVGSTGENLGLLGKIAKK